MEKRLRSAFKSSAQDFLSSASKLSLRSSKPTLKTLIYSVNPNSDLSSSLPLSLHLSISRGIQSFQDLSVRPEQSTPKPSESPPTKRLRRSARRSKASVEAGSDNDESDLRNERRKILQGLEVLAYVTNLCVSHPKKAFSPSELFPGARALHDSMILFEDASGDSVLLSEVASLCEEWWKEDIPGREALISQSLPFLLAKSLTLKRKVDVRRVHALREAFTMFDFEDESIEDLKLMIIRYVVSPVYLKTDEGRRFVAFVFKLSK